MYSYNIKNKQILKKEEQLKQVGLEFSKIHLSNAKRDNKWYDKLQRLYAKYENLHEEWLHLIYKNIVGRNKMIIVNQMHKRRIKKIEYFVWHEDFVDEDNGEVVSIERTKIVRINNVLVDKNEKPVEFDLTGKKIENW